LLDTFRALELALITTHLGNCPSLNQPTNFSDEPWNIASPHQRFGDKPSKWVGEAGSSSFLIHETGSWVGQFGSSAFLCKLVITDELPAVELSGQDVKSLLRLRGDLYFDDLEDPAYTDQMILA
jgi:hypothetical protein